MTEDDILAARKQSLYRKYDISEEQLDFKYVNSCQDHKKLEKILKILRTEEHGYFSDLEKATEARLREVCADSRMLLKEEQARSFNQLSKEEQNEVQDIMSWKTNDNELPAEEAKMAAERIKEYPAIRNIDKMLVSKPAPKPPKSALPRSYESWDKFDVEKELSLLDREEELERNKFIRERNEYKIEQDEAEEKIQSGSGGGGGDAYSKQYALNEKVKGNECYKAKEYDKALHHYNKSLSLAPLPDVYNNRAQTYICLDRFKDALEDCNKVLEMNPKDAKAYYRRSTALLKLGCLQEAYESIEEALKINPSDNAIQERANKLREQLNLPSSMKKVRMVIQEVGDSQKVRPFIEEIPQRDIYYPFSSSADNVQLNDIGTARHMCRCNGVPPFIAKLRSVEDTPHTNRLYLRKTRSKKSSCEKSASSRRSKKKSGALNGEIIEKDTIEAGEKIVSQNDDSLTKSLKSRLVDCLERDDLDGVFNEMTLLKPAEVRKALSGRLDSKTLNVCVEVLCVRLKHPNHWKLIYPLLLAFAQLPQFKSAVKLLEESTKKALCTTISAAEEQGQRVADVLTLYELNGAMPPPP